MDTSSKIAQGIWKVVPPVFLVLGTLGNVLSIVVLTRKNMQKSTTSVYLMALAVSDLSLIYSGLLTNWLHATFQLYTPLADEILCKLYGFCVYLFADLSGWILVAVTFERVVLVWRPHSGKKLCSRPTAAVIVGMVFTALAAINGHLLYGTGYREEKYGNMTIVQQCSIINDENYENFFFVTWPWIDLSVLFIGPFLFLVVGNSLIIGRMYHNRKKLQSRVGPQPIAPNSTNKKTSSMTVMLFLLNAAYFVSNTPITIYVLCLEDSDPSMETALLDPVYSICIVLMYANNTFNFVLYCMSGQKFRQELLSLCQCRKTTAVVPN